MPAQLVTIFFKLFILIPFIIPGSACTQNTKLPVKTPSTIKHSGLWTIEWSSDDKYFALGGDDSILWIYNASEPSVYKSYPMKHMASASDGLRIWTKDGQLLYTGKTREILWGIAWNRSGNRIITGSFDGDINLWTDKATPLKKVQ